MNVGKVFIDLTPAYNSDYSFLFLSQEDGPLENRTQDKIQIWYASFLVLYKVGIFHGRHYCMPDIHGCIIAIFKVLKVKDIVVIM